ncbi:MAG: HTH-type transcriptional regulator/antitoxin HigA, partial [Bacteroidia bacterium]
ETLKIIKTKADYTAAVARIDSLVQEVETKGIGLQELEVLGLLVSTYEDAQYPFENPHPVEAIRFMMEQHGMKAIDLAKLIGSKSRVSEVLNLKRGLSVEMMVMLNKHLHIPFEVLMHPYDLKAGGKTRNKLSNYPSRSSARAASAVGEPKKMGYVKKKASSEKGSVKTTKR